MSTLDLQLKTIRVYGTLAKILKRRTFQAVIRSPQDAINFLLSNFPELKSFIAPRAFQIIVNHKPITEHQLATNVDFIDNEIHIIPAISGAGGNNGPLYAILAGAALIAASFIFPFAAPILLPLGIGLVLTGAAALIAPVIPEDPEDADPAKSYNFSGVQNTSREGVAVPCVYGEIVTGSVTISLGIKEDEEEIENDFVPGPGDPCAANDQELLEQDTEPGYQMPGDPYVPGCTYPYVYPFPDDVPPPPDDNWPGVPGSQQYYVGDSSGGKYFWTFVLNASYSEASRFSCTDGQFLGAGAPWGVTLTSPISTIAQYVVVRMFKTRQVKVCSGGGYNGNKLWIVYYYTDVDGWKSKTNVTVSYDSGNGVQLFATDTSSYILNDSFRANPFKAFAPLSVQVTEKYKV